MVTRPSADCQTILFRRFSKTGKILKKSLNGHVTVVRRSLNRRLTVNQFYFDVSSKNGKILKKVAERPRDSRRMVSATVGRLSNNFFLTFQPKWQNFEKKIADRSRDSRRMVTRPSVDCQTMLFRRFSKNGKILKKKSLNGHATVVGWSRDRRLTVKQFYFDVSAKMAKL